MADAADSKSVGGNPVKVRLLSPAPNFSGIIFQFFNLIGLIDGSKATLGLLWALFA